MILSYSYTGYSGTHQHANIDVKRQRAFLNETVLEFNGYFEDPASEGEVRRIAWSFAMPLLGVRLSESASLPQR